MKPVSFVHSAVSLVLVSAVVGGCVGASNSIDPPVVQSVFGIDHVGLAVTKLESSKDFFVDILGFKIKKHDPEYPAYFLNNGYTTVTLWRVEDPETAILFDRRKNVGLHHLAFAVSSFEILDALHERLASYEGVEIEFTPELSSGGPAKHMMLREPSGNRIELVHRP